MFNPYSAFPRQTTYIPGSYAGMQRAANQHALVGGPRLGVAFAPQQGSYLNAAIRASAGTGGQHVAGVNEVLNRRGPLQAVHGRQRQLQGLEEGRNVNSTAASGRSPQPAPAPSSSLSSPIALANRGIASMFPAASGPGSNPVVQAMDDRIGAIFTHNNAALGNQVNVRPGTAGTESMTRPTISFVRKGR